MPYRSVAGLAAIVGSDPEFIPVRPVVGPGVPQPAPLASGMIERRGRAYELRSTMRPELPIYQPKPGRTLIVTKAEVFAVRNEKWTLCALMQQTIMAMHGRKERGD